MTGWSPTYEDLVDAGRSDDGCWSGSGRRERRRRGRRRLGHVPRIGAGARPRRTSRSATTDEHEEHDAEQRGGEDRRPELLRAGDVVLVEVDDHAAQARLDAARALADDRADDARGRRDLERREQVGQRRRQPQLPVDLAVGDAAYERISSSARGSGERRPRIIAIVTGKNVRYVAMTTTAATSLARARTRSSGRGRRSGRSGWRRRTARTPARAAGSGRTSWPAPSPMTAPSANPRAASRHV